jgi:hypothetical protein
MGARTTFRIGTTRLNSFLTLLCSLYLALFVVPVIAQTSTRDQEIAQCLPGEIATWADGKDRTAVSSPMVFVYDHTNAPPWFSQAQVVATVQAAAVAWSQCGVPTSVSTVTSTPHSVRIQWGDQSSRGNFGLANMGERTLSLGPAAFQLLQSRNPKHDARETLQMVISHEMGHLYGLVAHSRRCVDVTSYYDNGKGESCYTRTPQQLRTVTEYRSALPTACDIQRCKQANGVSQ